MTKQEKQLLLIDLCARLPYGTIVHGEFPYSNGEKIVVEAKDEPLTVSVIDWIINGIDNVKPYLRPMSSMTEEEALKLWDLLYSSYRRNKILEIIIKQECIDYILDDGVASTETFSIYYDNVVRTIDTFDWLNFHHFDYRGLIPMGLALEAPEGMYK